MGRYYDEKRNIYKILLMLGFSIYFLFSILFIKGAMVTYQSIVYNFGSFLSLGIFNYIKILYHTLYFINLFIIIIIVNMIINNRCNKILFTSYCIIHFIMCVLYYFNYNYYTHYYNIISSYIYFMIVCIIPITLSMFLYKKYIKNIMKNKDVDII
jgi:hypothetical protein